MRKRTLALILSLAMLVGLVSATGLFSAAAAEDAQWKADETGGYLYDHRPEYRADGVYEGAGRHGKRSELSYESPVGI